MKSIFPRVVGYRIDLPEEQLEAQFTPNSKLVLTPDMVGPGQTLLEGIVGEGVELTVAETEGQAPQHRAPTNSPSTCSIRYFRDADGEPQLHLFGQIQRIVRRWIDEGYLDCKGGTGPCDAPNPEHRRQSGGAHLCGHRRRHRRRRAHQARCSTPTIRRARPAMSGSSPAKTSMADRLRRKCHVNYVVCDSDWEAEFARVAEAHPRVLAYVKNQGLGVRGAVPDGSTARYYMPDFIVQHRRRPRADDPLHLVVEIKGYRGAKT